MRYWLAAAALGSAAVESAAGAQAAAEAKLRQAVAVLVARGINAADSAPVTSQGTGFFINSMGIIVTSYHLRGDLPQSVHPESITYEVHVDALSPPIPATQVFASPETDILVLYAPMDGKNIGTLKRADRKTAKIELAKTPVYAASYTSGYGFSLTPGVITSFAGPINPVFPAWTTNVSYGAGQSGSPLVLDDGRVVAIVKGADTQGASIGVVVPILFIPPQFWETDTTLQASLAALPVDKSVFTNVVVSKVAISNAPRTVVRTLTLKRGPCDPPGAAKAHFVASQGWSIDPSSIAVSQRSFRGARVQTSVKNATPGGFVVFAEMQPTGVCNTAGGDEIAAGDGASLSALVRFSETPREAFSQRIVVAEAAALGGLKLPVGSDPQSLDFALRSPDGSLKPFTPAKAALRVDHGQAVLDVGRALSPFM